MGLKNFFKIKSSESFATFNGGIHPDDAKSATNTKEIINLEAPEELVFPLSQHIGAPAVPCGSPSSLYRSSIFLSWSNVI